MTRETRDPARRSPGAAQAPAALRCAFYVCYSSDLQRAASIEDQIEVCRRYAERQGWTVGPIYQDAATSGGSRFRPGFAKLMAEAEAGRFDVLVCEAIDRLGRKLADIADMFDRLQFRRIQIHATALGGPVTAMHIGMLGTMAQMMLSDLREKTWRGQLGRALAGAIPEGLAYGYEVVAAAADAKEAGGRRIVPEEAAIVRRIFRDYVAGRSARAIAKALNEEGIPGPGGRSWIDTTIRGQVDRGTGILNNSLYVGRLAWNRCSYIKDPSNGQRVARVNPESEWEVVDVPDLRIIDDALWEATKQRQREVRIEIGRDEAGNTLNRAHRRQFLLSGLLTCGCCGGGYTILGKDRYGCATRKGRGTCDNAKTITRQRIEARVLTVLRGRLLTPELVEQFVRTFAMEWAELERQAGARRATAERGLAETERSLKSIVIAIEKNPLSETLQTRLRELEAKKAQLAVELASLNAPRPATLHPNAAAIFAHEVAALEEALNGDDVRLEASEGKRCGVSTLRQAVAL